MNTMIEVVNEHGDPIRIRTGIGNRPSTRLEKLVPRKYNTIHKIPEGLCIHCGENEATTNLSCYCRRCFFYMKNNYNKRMYEEGICLTCDQKHITDGRLYCIKCKPDIMKENK